MHVWLFFFLLVLILAMMPIVAKFSTCSCKVVVVVVVQAIIAVQTGAVYWDICCSCVAKASKMAFNWHMKKYYM